MAYQLLQNLGKELMRYGTFISDTITTEEDLVDESRIHYVRVVMIICNGERYLVRMRDGEYVEVKYDYDHPVMMEKNAKYREDIEGRLGIRK